MYSLSQFILYGIHVIVLINHHTNRVAQFFKSIKICRNRKNVRKTKHFSVIIVISILKDNFVWVEFFSVRKIFDVEPSPSQIDNYQLRFLNWLQHWQLAGTVNRRKMKANINKIIVTDGNRYELKN